MLFSLVGVVKGVLTTIIGFFTFGGIPVTVLVLLGVFLNTFGGALYSYAKYAETMTSGIEKHFHKHTIRVKSDESTAEHTGNVKNGFVSLVHDHGHKAKNGFNATELIKINPEDVVIELDERRSSSDSSSCTESSVD